MDALLHAYRHPSAELDLEDLEALLGSRADELSAIRGLGGLGGLDFALDAVRATHDRLSQSAFEAELDADLEGHLSIRSTCPGFDVEAPDPERDGTIELYAPVDEAALGPVVFGPAVDGRIDTRTRCERASSASA